MHARSCDCIHLSPTHDFQLPHCMCVCAMCVRVCACREFQERRGWGRRHQACATLRSPRCGPTPHPHTCWPVRTHCVQTGSDAGMDVPAESQGLGDGQARFVGPAELLATGESPSLQVRACARVGPRPVGAAAGFLAPSLLCPSHDACCHAFSLFPASAGGHGSG